jgi:hypothetical protein
MCVANMTSNQRIISYDLGRTWKEAVVADFIVPFTYIGPEKPLKFEVRIAHLWANIGT